MKPVYVSSMYIQTFASCLTEMGLEFVKCEMGSGLKQCVWLDGYQRPQPISYLHARGHSSPLVSSVCITDRHSRLTMPTAYSDDLRWRIVRLQIARDMSPSEITDLLCVSESTVHLASYPGSLAEI